MKKLTFLQKRYRLARCKLAPTFLFTIILAAASTSVGVAQLISVDTPIDNLLTNNTTIIVSGTAEKNAIVTVNDNVVVNDNGNFSSSINLDEGLNTIIIKANPSGREQPLKMPIQVFELDTTTETPLNAYEFNLTNVTSAFAMDLVAEQDGFGLKINIQKSGGSGLEGVTIEIVYSNGSSTEKWKTDTGSGVAKLIDSVNNTVFINLLNSTVYARYKSSNNSWTWNSIYNTSNDGPLQLDVVVQHYMKLMSLLGSPVSFNPQIPIKSHYKGFDNDTSTYILDYRISDRISTITRNVTLDTTCPVISITPPKLVNGLYNKTTLNISYTSNDTDIAFYEVKLNNDSWINNSLNISYQFYNLSQGMSTIYIRAIDHAGNNGSDSIDIKVDSIPPTITLTKPLPDTKITTRYIELAGTTENGATVTVNNLSVHKVNQNWNTNVTLLKLNNVFTIKSEDLAGNIAEKTLYIRLGANFSADKTLDEIIQNMSVGFNRIKGYKEFNEMFAGKYVSFEFDNKTSAIINYTIEDTLWFNNINISGFSKININITDSTVKLEQSMDFGERHNISVSISDSQFGTMLIDVRESGYDYEQIRKYLLNKSVEILKITVSRDLSTTIESKIYNQSKNESLNKNESWRRNPRVTLEFANGVNVEQTDNGYKLTKEGLIAHLIKTNYAGGSTTFDLIPSKNLITADMIYSLLIFTQTTIKTKNGPLNLGDNFDLINRIAQEIANGTIRALLVISGNSSITTTTITGVSIRTEFINKETLNIIISSTSGNGTVVTVYITDEYFEKIKAGELTIEYDGKRINEADDYDDIMNIYDDNGEAEYFTTIGTNGAVVLVSIPKFSTHSIKLIFVSPEKLDNPTTVSLYKFMMFIPTLSKSLIHTISEGPKSLLVLLWWIVLLFGFIMIRKMIKKKYVRSEK
ncbi:MAG TPA: hypothetical protein EYP22_01165 [Methanosarcinales archaeon]|nr:hypothetical protein [Methanosarcinales archaeon]